MLVAPTYPGIGDPESEVSRRAVQQHVSCWTIDQLARVVENAERRQINVRHIEEIVFKSFMPLDVEVAVSSLLADPVYDSRDLYRAVLASFRSLAPRLQNTPRHILLVAAEVSREEMFASIDTPAVRKAVEDMARASKGIMYITDDDNVYILGDLDELERRVSELDGVRRTAATWKFSWRKCG